MFPFGIVVGERGQRVADVERVARTLRTRRAPAYCAGTLEKNGIFLRHTLEKVLFD